MLSLCCFSAPAAWGQERPDRLTSLTHLNGTSRQIAHLATNCLGDRDIQSFNYDIGGQPFTTVPKGFSFVITDIIVSPCALVPNFTDHYLVRVVIGGGERHFVAASTGHVPQHYALTGGLVVPEFGRLSAWNIFTSGVIVQVLGYFVRGPGLATFHPFPFPEDETVPENKKSDN